MLYCDILKSEIRLKAPDFYLRTSCHCGTGVPLNVTTPLDELYSTQKYKISEKITFL